MRSRRGHGTRLGAAVAIGVLVLLPGVAVPAAAQPADPEPKALPSLDVPTYLGRWYQVAWFPNRFQRQCVSDTVAEYRERPDGNLDVLNRCRLADGSVDEARGVARPSGSRREGNALVPAQLEVSFLPAWLRWVPAWGRYWVLDRADDGRYAVVGEPSRQYLWVLSRGPALSPADEVAIRSRLAAQGYDLGRWQSHPHLNAAAGNAPASRPVP